MAKFCKKCGKKLEEGQVCDCQGVVSNQQPVVSNNTNGVDINEIINSYIEIVKGLFVRLVHPQKYIRRQVRLCVFLSNLKFLFQE